MSAFLLASALSFGIVFLAELGDKSQLMAMSFAARYRLPAVVLGIAIASAGVQALSVTIGQSLGAVLPTDWIAIDAGLLFIAFAVWTLRNGTGDRADRLPEPRKPHHAVVTVTFTFIVAELGDKTMLATLALATQHNPWGVWLGSTTGMVAASLLAVIVGHQIGLRVPERVIAVGAACLFAIVGVWVLAESVPMVIA